MAFIDPIPPDGRVPVLFLTPLIAAFGIWVMITGRIGRGPSPIEGPLAILLGAMFVFSAVTFFIIAWVKRGRSKT